VPTSVLEVVAKENSTRDVVVKLYAELDNDVVPVYEE
jgi:hypothetical protein